LGKHEGRRARRHFEGARCERVLVVDDILAILANVELLEPGFRDDDDRQMARAFERTHVAAQSQAVGRGQVQADDDEIVGFVGGRRADQELYVAQAWRPQQGGCRCRLSRSSPLP
jgi:hypothetical protein